MIFSLQCGDAAILVPNKAATWATFKFYRSWYKNTGYIQKLGEIIQERSSYALLYSARRVNFPKKKRFCKPCLANNVIFFYTGNNRTHLDMESDNIIHNYSCSTVSVEM